MGGFMSGTGVLTILAAMNAPAAQKIWARVAFAITGLFTVGTMSLINFQIDSVFKWLLLIPSLLWGVAVVLSTVVKSPDR